MQFAKKKRGIELGVLVGVGLIIAVSYDFICDIDKTNLLADTRLRYIFLVQVQLRQNYDSSNFCPTGFRTHDLHIMDSRFRSIKGPLQ